MLQLKNKLLLGLAVFVVICFLASPMFMGETGQSFNNQIETEEGFDDFNSRQTYILSDGENWLSGWRYRQQHTIGGSAGAGVNYQMKFHVEYNVASSSGNIVDCNSHCQTNFGDIRFTDNDGDTQLDYWMQEKTDSDDATFWVEVKDDLGSARNIYVYYGTSGTTATTSEGDNTFIAFDDFEDNNLNKWDDVGANVATQSGTVYAGTYAVFMNPGAGASEGMYYNFTEAIGSITYSVMMTYHVRQSSTAKVWYDRLTGAIGGTGK